MRTLLALLLLTVTAFADDFPLPRFDILPGDRVLLLGDTLLEREGTYGYLETRMHEQFADRPFTVRNLSWAGDTPLGLSRASFDAPAAGWERLKASIAAVRPTVVFLGYGMAASLQQLTEQSHDPTLNADPARYGAEPMTPARFKREMGMLMDAIGGKAEGGGRRAEEKDHPAQPPSSLPTSALRPPPFPSPRFVLLSPIRHEDLRAQRPGLPDPAAHNKLLAEYAKAIEELAQEKGAKFVDLMEATSTAGDLARLEGPMNLHPTENGIHLNEVGYQVIDSAFGRDLGWEKVISRPIGAKESDQLFGDGLQRLAKRSPLRAAVIAKNALFFNQFRPANSTYLFGFRKHEQGQNAKEMAQFDPLIAAAEAEIERLKQQSKSASTPLKPTRIAPVQGRTVPAQGGITPVQGSIAPVQGGIAPVQGSIAPVQGGIAPVQGSIAPAQGGIAPVQGSIAPVQGGIAPVQGSIAPVQGGGSLDKGVVSPLLPTFTAEDGYQIDLWAENPLLEKPTQMNWDALGRLWVCSSSLYPMIEPGQPADDKILILSDPDKTGKATKSEVFARGLLIPTGVVPDLLPDTETRRRGDAEKIGSTSPEISVSPSPRVSASAAYGCYVGQSTELLHFSPTGEKRIVLSGFGTEDTHHIIHTLRWGPDGRLYFNQSIYIHSHLETPWGLVRLNSGGCLAYDPRTERLEVFAKGWVNSWGHAWDRWGQSFFTDGAGGGGINWAFPGAQFTTYEGARQTVPSVSPGSYPKFAGLELIYSPAFPPEWQGNAVTCDFRAHRIVRFAITDLAGGKSEGGGRRAEDSQAAAPQASSPPPAAGANSSSALRPPPSDLSSAYTTREMPDLVRTSDLSFRPIDVKLGPDGALYVADWSNPVINHGEVDFRDPRRDHHMGRIWRISKKGGAGVQWEPLAGKKNEEVLEGLLSGNLWEKEQARQVLSKRQPIHVADGSPAATIVQSMSDWWSDHSSVDEARQKRRADEPTNPFLKLWTPAIGQRVQFELLQIERSWSYFEAWPRYDNLMQVQDARYRSQGARLGGEAVAWVLKNPEWKGKLFGAAQDTLHYVGTLTTDTNPRVRLEAMRALARIPTARSAELVLDAAVGDFTAEAQRTQRGAEGEKQDAAAPSPSTQNPSADLSKTSAPLRSNETPPRSKEPDVFYQHAAWLSINDLAQPWLAALADGTWKPEGREKQLAFALGALPPDAARGALVQVLGTAPRDLAKGPWVELIGRSGGPAELRRLLDAMLVSFGTDCCPGEELKNLHALPIDDATALRCVAALLEAARVRNQRPDGDLLPVERLVFRTGGAVRAGLLRLVGYWKPAPGLDWLRGVFDESALDPAQAASAIESLRDLGGAPAVALLQKLALPTMPAPTRQRAAVALAALDVKGEDSFTLISAAIGAAPDEATALATWRELFKIQPAIDALVKKNVHFMKEPVVTAGVRAAREAGKKGEALLAALTPLAGNVPKPAPAAADFKGIAARMWTQGGDAAQGELIYRRATLGCVTCHAIGGAGGIVGPSLTSLGASAPADYIIESLLVPNAKVKEGYNGVTLKLKDGTEVMGIAARETAQEVILRNVAGQETAVPKANITGKTDIGSIMPAGLLDALNDNERMNLYCFLAELGKPGPFDASKANTARVWKLYPGTATDLALKGAASDASANALTLVDGRLLKAQLAEALQLVTNPGPVIYAVTQFQSTGKTRLDLTGIAKAFLDGQPLTITADLAPELPAGLHTLAIKLDTPTLPEVLRATSPDASFVAN